MIADRFKKQFDRCAGAWPKQPRPRPLYPEHFTATIYVNGEALDISTRMTNEERARLQACLDSLKQKN